MRLSIRHSDTPQNRAPTTAGCDYLPGVVTRYKAYESVKEFYDLEMPEKKGERVAGAELSKQSRLSNLAHLRARMFNDTSVCKKFVTSHPTMKPKYTM
jgi:hypothetical protein